MQPPGCGRIAWLTSMLRLIHNRKALLGLAVAGSGLALLAMVGGYGIYAAHARSQLPRLVVAGPSSPRETLPKEWLAAQSRERFPEQQADPAVGSRGLRGVENDATVSPPSSFAPVPPGPAGPRFRWVDWATLPTTQGVAPKATWIVIPAIDVDSPVVDVSIVWDGKARVWQRPKNSVGHHDGTASPGELGNVVLSGHINSPVRGEGNVFKHLPELPELLELGQQVEVLVYTEDRTYVYQVVRSDVVAPESRDVFEPTREPTVSLITCVPDMVFSHRLVVTAWLVRVAEGGRPSAGQTVKGVVVEPWPQNR